MKRRQLLVGISTLALATPIPRQAPAWWHALGPQAPPLVTSISPNSGLSTGNTPVTISGAGFTHVTAVKIGGVSATNIVVASDTSITANTPGGTVGSASVVVTTLGGSNAPNTLFNYTSGAGLPTGLLQSTPLGGGAFTVVYSEAGSGASANGDGTTGWQTPSSGPQLSGWTVLQIWWNCPADQYYQFKIPARCAAFSANPANSLAISVDQVPAQFDGGTTANLNWFMAFVSNIGAVSTDYSFTAAATAGLHSIVIYLCNGAHFGTGALNNITHYERLNIFGTGTPLPIEPTAPGQPAPNRNPALQPYSSYHFLNTPFGANAQFRPLSDPACQTINGTGGNGASIGLNAGSFSTNVWIGTNADPVMSLTSPDVTNTPTAPVSTPVPCRVPAGAYPSPDNTDLNVALIDGTNPRYAYAGIEWFQNGPRTANFDFGIVDAYNLNHGVPQGFGNMPGLIRVYDCDNGVIAHRLLGHMGFPPTQVGGVFTSAPGGYAPASQSSQWSGMPWPACQSDSAWHQANEYNNPNGVPYGAVAGIHPSAVRPAGMNAATAMLWDCFANYGVWFNVTGGTYPGWGIYAEGAVSNHPALTGISFNTIRPFLALLTTASQAPIIVGQGLGGGAPKVALAPGVTQGYPSIGRSPYTFPASPVGIPLQIAHANPGVTVPGGVAAGTTSFGPAVPIGSFVLLFLSLDRAAAVNFNTPFTDSRGNSYTVLNSPASGSTWHPAIAYCPSTTVAMGSGTSWTLNLSPGGVANYFVLGAFYRPPPPSGSTLLRVSNTASTASNLTTLSTSLAGVQVNDLVVGFTYTSNYAEITNPGSMGSLNSTPPMNIAFQRALSAGTFNFNPTWDRASPAGLVVAAFANVNIAT